MMSQGLITPPMIQNIRYGTYIFFCCFCAIALVWVYFLVPETNGRTLEQMDLCLGTRLLLRSSKDEQNHGWIEAIPCGPTVRGGALEAKTPKFKT
jgi:hypothetical protein